jgi:hypothetical protein
MKRLIWFYRLLIFAIFCGLNGCQPAGVINRHQKLLLPDNPKNLTQSSLRKIIKQSVYNQYFSAREPDGFDFTAIDKYAQKAPDGVKTNTKTLSAYLVKPARNDWEKVRAIYTWIIYNIAYDTRVFDGIKVSTDPTDVLRTGYSICSGYSDLFSDLAVAAGIEIESISGCGKGHGYQESANSTKTNHAWNAVKIDGKWHLFDATWGAGGVDKNREFIKDPTCYWFDTPPDEFIFSHLPEDITWQLLPASIPANDFLRLPRLTETYFESGFSGRDAITCSGTGFSFKFPVTYDPGNINYRIVKAPMPGVLRSGQQYYFQFYAPGKEVLLIKNGSENIRITTKTGYFAALVSANPGTIKICLPKADSGNQYAVLIEYEVQ